MINVEHINETEFIITWDEKDPVEKILNDWTEQDFVNVIQEHLKKLSEESS